MTPGKRTIIEMCDNRAPSITSLYRARYFELAAVINFIFAKTHGYAFRYYVINGENRHTPYRTTDQNNTPNFSPVLELWRKFAYLIFTNAMGYKSLKWLNKYFLQPFYTHYGKTDTAMMKTKDKRRKDCRHILYGYRAAPWCKIISIYEALVEGFDRVVYVDTDAILDRHEWGVRTFWESTPVVSGDPVMASLIMTDNYPWPHRDANTGFLIWRNGLMAMKMARAWWDMDAGIYHHKHDFDQYAIQKVLIDSPDYKAHIAILKTVSFREKIGQFVRHVGSDQDHLRVPRFRLSLNRLGVRHNEFSSLVQELRRHHVVLLDPAQSRIHQ